MSEGVSKNLLERYFSGDPDRDKRVQTKVGVGSTKPEGMTIEESSKIYKHRMEKYQSVSQRPAR